MPEDELDLGDSLTVILLSWRGRLRAARRPLDLAAVDLERVGAWAGQMGLLTPTAT